jgi:type II secretory pathway component PulM
MTRADWLLIVAVAACLPLLYAHFWQPAFLATRGPGKLA